MLFIDKAESEEMQERKKNKLYNLKDISFYFFVLNFL